jgi:putative nucleotidyltransferase with HDIG domain
MSVALGLEGAEQLLTAHLGGTPRADHSRYVGAVMAALARRLGADVELWHITGLLHDIDYPATSATPDRHGPLAAEWLVGRLPEEALIAIAGHDHRAGITADTPIAHALKLADAIAVLDEQVGRSVLLASLEDGPAALHRLVGQRPWRQHDPRALGTPSAPRAGDGRSAAGPTVTKATQTSLIT